jgi:hypothetical protein
MTIDFATTIPSEIRIKFLGKFRPGHDGEGWHHLFPGNVPVWGNCRFIFDRDCRNYDWLVVYDDMPSCAGERHPLWEEELACPSQHTLLITTEPPTIKVYGTAYLNQFRWLLTSQPKWVTGNHPGRIFEQPALIWFYSNRSPRGDYDTLRHHVPLNKTLDVSTMCSSKRQGNTLHRRRYDFTMALKERLPGLDMFGHGVRAIVDKADALDPYRYHIAVENFAGPHHWTEKLSDPFLGACMPLYYGCPNVADYFPEESFLHINIWDVDEAVETIERAVRDRLHEKCLPAILESRRLVLEKYGPIATISRIVNERHQAAHSGQQHAKVLQSRRRIHANLIKGMRYLTEKLYVRGRYSLGLTPEPR